MNAAFPFRCGVGLQEEKVFHADGQAGAWTQCVCVPNKLLHPFLWRHVYSVRVHDAHVCIPLKEAEAALIAVKHLVRSGQGGQGERHLILGDNVSLASVVGKRICGFWRWLGSGQLSRWGVTCCWSIADTQ